MRAKTKARQIDALMDKACSALAEMQYFDAERQCVRALVMAHVAADFDRMSRILLPLEEARRQKRQQAVDTGNVVMVGARADTKLIGKHGPGCYLVQPPLVGVDGRTLREAADRKKIPILLVTREPLTRAGRWPVVAVGQITVRAQLDPPKPMTRAEESVTKDAGDVVPSPAWFLHAAEAMGLAAINNIDRTEHLYYQVDALMQQIEAHPDDDRLHQELADTCRAAISEPAPTRPRKRPEDVFY